MFTSGNVNQQLYYPMDVGLNPSETIMYLSNNGNNRIQRFHNINELNFCMCYHFFRNYVLSSVNTKKYARGWFASSTHLFIVYNSIFSNGITNYSQINKKKKIIQ